jgi:hypothetical protein
MLMTQPLGGFRRGPPAFTKAERPSASKTTSRTAGVRWFPLSLHFCDQGVLGIWSTSALCYASRQRMNVCGIQLANAEAIVPRRTTKCSA